MIHFLAIGIIVCAVSYSSASETTTLSASVTTTSPCSGDNLFTVAAACLEAYGLGAEFIRFQTNLTTAQDLKESCSHPESYQQAIQCVKNATASCLQDAAAASFEQSVKDNLAFCGDPKISFECLAEYSRKRLEVQACAISHWALKDLISRISQEIMCYGQKLSIQCAGEFLRPCDAYTATAVETKLKLSIPLVCYFYPDIVG